MSELTAQQKANRKQYQQQKNQPTFRQVRFKEEIALNKINETIKKHGGTKEAALIDAFELLDKHLEGAAK
jgi:hypothetical protein